MDVQDFATIFLFGPIWESQKGGGSKKGAFAKVDWLCFLCEGVCFRKGILTRNRHLACYCDLTVEGCSTIARKPPPNTIRISQLANPQLLPKTQIWPLLSSCRLCTQSSLGVSQWPLALFLLQKYRDPNGRRIVIQIQISAVYTTFRQEEGILFKNIAIEMGGVSRYFQK